MALNKSSKSTPGSRSGYFSELTASAGKQTNFLLPVRIKVTPNSTLATLSNEKNNPAKMLQPVLIKDLFKSTQKERHNSSVISVSTQKKKNKSQRLAQDYLSTQSCHKPKHGEDESTFFNRKSYGHNVRRQLYQNSDSPNKNLLENKENSNKIAQVKKKTTKNSEITSVKNAQTQNKSRKSLLLPPNSIKNSYIKKSGTNVKPSTKPSSKNNTTITNKQKVKGASGNLEKGKLKNNIKTNIHIDPEDEVDIINSSLSDTEEYEKKQTRTMRDNSTMTSIDMKAFSSKSFSDLNKLDDRPSVIMSTKTKSATKCSNGPEPPCSMMQNLNINKICNCAEKTEVSNEIVQNKDFDVTKITDLNQKCLMQIKTSLEQSIQASEDHILKLKQTLNFVNNLFNNIITMNTKNDSDENCDLSNTIVNNLNNSNTTNAVATSLEEKNITNDVNALTTEARETKTADETKSELAEKLPIIPKILTSDLNQEMIQESSDVLSELARLSTIGEVSYEYDESNKDEKSDLENKENICDSIKTIATPQTPQTPKALQRKSKTLDNSDSQNRRRSDRLAAKRLSLSTLADSDSRGDSFTLLENELNVVHNSLPSSSISVSPMKPPVTPGIIKQWGKKVEKPLREYMALKMNGTLLVTPDVKRFQSCLETTDTPHSRKSLSRKIFMELCDLYAESPESK